LKVLLSTMAPDRTASSPLRVGRPGS